ncbi:MAG: YdeI/OmpD-associated family protein [Chloroflexi bacterium]|nr:YdeI/OmpD-associated family protein [Chloroflexota bacterium]MBV9896596.1 YdeI/OmpD-associated family protein [Chloroflexota bacterium]
MSSGKSCSLSAKWYRRSIWTHARARQRHRRWYPESPVAKTATGICVPEEVVTWLGSGQPAHNKGGEFMLPISAEIRRQTGVAARDEFDVEVALDTEPREIAVAADLAVALAAQPRPQRRFEALSYSDKRVIVEPIEQAKARDTRERRITNEVESLLGWARRVRAWTKQLPNSSQYFRSSCNSADGRCRRSHQVVNLLPEGC